MCAYGVGRAEVVLHTDVVTKFTLSWSANWNILERITVCVHVAAVLKNSFPFARGMNFCTRVSKKASFPEPPVQSRYMGGTEE